MNDPTYQQSAIRWAALDPTHRGETKKKQPGLTLQDDIVNQGSPTVIVAPILPDHKDWPFVVNLKPTKSNGLDREHHVNIKQLRAVDVSRITNKQGTLEKRYWEPVKAALGIVLNL